MSWSNRAGRKLPVAIFVLVLAAVAAAVLLPSASAVVTAPNSLGLFQLDGNATTDPSPPAPAGEDWDKVYANTGSYFSHVFVGAATEAPANDVTYFQGGGSKDTNDIPQWAWGPTNVTPDKTEILDAYGASYIDPTSKDTIVYFGMDRFDTSGDSNVGFWFLKDPTFGLVGTGSGTFSGQHQDGDLFVLSQFTTGGTVPTIQVYEWQNGALILKSSGTGCTTDNVACAAVNGSSSIQVPWPYQDKGGDAAGTVPATGFFEGGIDLNSIFGGSVPCFSNFLGETRSSQSTSAQLKDFAIGQINSCGSITIVKNASPTDASASFGFSGSGPDPKVGNFSLDGSNGSGARQSFESIHPGSYTFDESNIPAHWQFDHISCDSTQSTNGSQLTINLAAGQNVTCTYYNTRKPTLTLKKNVVNDDGGTADASAWLLAATGTGGFSGHGAPATGTSASVGPTDVNAGVSYALSESGGPSGYDAGSWSCDGGTMSDATHVTLAAGDNVTCSITNDDQAPKLVVIKHVVNDNGGTKAAGDFTMSVTGTNATPASFAGDEHGTNVSLSAGSYSVDEGAHDGYSKTLSADCSGTIALGETKTCTITNDDIAPKLVVIKHVINDNGGTKTAGDFTMSVAGSNVSNSSFAGDEHGTTVTLDAGSYSVDEGAHNGYAKTLSADCSGTIAPGETKTCTVTNDDIQPKLVVIKHVVNDNGGSKTAADFTMAVTGTNASTSSFAGDEQGTNVALDAGSYSVDEGAHDGYTKSLSADCSGTIAVGETKTCTVTNDDIAPRLTLIKHVVNDSGGSEPAHAWTLTASGSDNSQISGQGSPSTGNTATFGPNSATAGITYTLSESGPGGYTAGSWSCGTTPLGGTDGNQLVLKPGDDVTCEITNNDNPATLIVIKHVINDNGGTKTAGDFTMNVTGSNPSKTSFAGDEQGTTVSLDAGSYSVDEGAHDGYAKSLSADCSGTIALGETKTCTVTNDDIQPKLVVIKHVVNDNGGSKTAADFTMAVTGTNASPASFPGDEQGTNVALDAGSYSVDEGAHDGYTKSLSADCSGTIAVGETKTCTVTNDDIAPTLTLVKHVTNDNGGTATADQWKLAAAGSGGIAATNGTLDQSGAGVVGPKDVTAGVAYTLSESGGPSGYAASAWSCVQSVGEGTSPVDLSGTGKDQLTLAVGQHVTCSITNNDIQPKLVVVKHVINDDGGTKSASDFTLAVTGPNASPASFAGSEQGTNVALDAGTYSVAEGDHSGYTESTQGDCSGTIGAGETKTCTIVNDDIASPPPPQPTPPATPTPPPPPPAPVIDLQITKTDSPDPDLIGKTLRYRIVVKNNGPDTAHNVQMSDPLPVEVTFSSVTTTQGTCTGGQLVSCQLGTLEPNASATITIYVKPRQTGIVTNTATTVGSEAESNTANNTATATTLVTAPFKPPVVNACYAVAITPHQLTAGKRSILVLRVKTNGKPAKGVRVLVTGPGVRKLSGPTNAQGIVRVTVKPAKPGILRFQPMAHKGCSAPRIGVIGAFTPPVTG